jgi:Fatty acid hydroxylase superfamily
VGRTGHAGGRPGTALPTGTQETQAPIVVHNDTMARRVNARGFSTKRELAVEFAHHGSGYVLAAGVMAGLALRQRGPRSARADLVAVTVVAGLQPLVEWGLHRFLLHAPARAVAGRRVDPAAAHRGHHQVPDDVGGALLGTGFALSNATVVAAAAAGIGRLVAGPAGMGAAVASGEGGLLAYEWVHLMCHSGYRPRTAWLRQVRTAHLRHHFRNEKANFGITSRLADRLLGTAA